MDDARRRTILIVGGLLAVAIVVAGIVALWPSDEKPAAQRPPIPTTMKGPSPGTLIDTFFTAMERGNAAEAGPMTDNPAVASAAITEFGKATSAIGVKYRRVTSADPPVGSAKVTTNYEATWATTSPWKYPGTIDVVKAGDQWKVRWAPSVIFPKLTEGQNLAVLGSVGPSGKAAVVDKDGKSLAVWEGSTAKAVNPKVAPLLLPSMVRSAGSAPGSADGRYIAIIDATGKPVEPAHGTPPDTKVTEPAKTTLSESVSVAAQDAVGKATNGTMLVAIRSSTGGILAVAQNAAAGETPNALNGLYAPGSTFKIATATAAMTQAGMSPDSDVQCPGTGTFGGRLIKNANSFDKGATKLHVAFAKSCNTTFADIAAKLPADGLKKAADQLGLNSDFTIPGITTELGKVEAASNPTQRVEDGIGQGKVLASPLGMAVVAATVASGKKITPKLWIGNDTHVGADYQPPPGTHLASLRQMMGEVVSNGTATTLRGLRVSGKTGTAETNNDGTKAHGWFVGFKGDVAFAVLVVDAGSSKAALDVSRAFAAALK